MSLFFWKKVPQPVATPTDQEWVEESLQWVLGSFGRDTILGLPTLIPNTKDFPHSFDGTAKDAEFVLGQVCRTMDVERAAIELLVEEDENIELAEGFNISPADRKGYWKSAAGTFQELRPERYRITINSSTLKDAQKLIATTAHEVCHIKLLGEGRIDNDDPEHELLTDLATIAFGYGIFQANTAFSMSKWQGSSHSGWSMSRTGYLPEPVIAHALALLVVLKKEEPIWMKYLNSTVRKYFDRSYRFLLKRPLRMHGENSPMT